MFDFYLWLNFIALKEKKENICWLERNWKRLAGTGAELHLGWKEFRKLIRLLIHAVKLGALEYGVLGFI